MNNRIVKRLIDPLNKVRETVEQKVSALDAEDASAEREQNVRRDEQGEPHPTIARRQPPPTVQQAAGQQPVSVRRPPSVRDRGQPSRPEPVSVQGHSSSARRNEAEEKKSKPQEDAGPPIDLGASEAVSRLRQRIAQAGELLTGEGGVYERRLELRDILALFEDGLFLVSKSHVDDPHVASFEGLLRRKGVRVQKVACDMSIVREVYESGDRKDIVKGESSVSSMQRDIMRFIADVTKQKTSDAHIVVDRESCQVRLRVDGVMRPYLEWRSNYGAEFLAAIFAMADASDASYQPYEYQGARVSDASVRLPSGVQAIRLQFNPLAYGGRHCVMRFLYRGSEEVKDVDTLGYVDQQIEYLQRMRAMPMGINIIAGPTGSGKSTTLQRSLASLISQRNHEISVFTVEDPPEYTIKGAQQMPVVNAPTPEERAVKFTQAINAALRSDPDVIMIGEVRDGASAKLAFEAAMTGHQVWTTLHATDAITIMSRLKDIGVEDFKLFDPSVVTGLVSQRLMRTLCPECRTPLEQALSNNQIDPALIDRLGPALSGDLSQVHVRGPGCSKCDNKGVSGRTVVAECVLPDMRFMQFLHRNDRAGAENYWIRQEGAMSMMLHGLYKIHAGIASPEEVERVLGPIEPHHKLDKSNYVTAAAAE